MERYIIFILTAIFSLICWLVFRGERKKYFAITMKILAIVYIAVVFFRYILSDQFIWVINKGTYNGKYYEETDLLQTILRWGHHLSSVVIVMAVFFNSRLFKNIAIYIVLPFTISTTIFYADFMAYFMDEVFVDVSRGIHTAYWFRSLYFSIELVLGLLLPILFVVVDKHYFNLKDKQEWKNFLISIPFIFLAGMPVYVPQSLFGYTQFTTSALTKGNFLWIAITLAEIAILFFVFRFKDYRARYMLCMFLALSLFMHYNSMYLMGFSIARLPVQLCNLASYFFVLVLLLKKKQFFNFIFLANIVGTLIAMVAPDTDGGFGGFWNMHFLIEHMQVLVIPMLCMLLRIFPRMDKNAIKHLIIGFSIYFAFCWVSGTILNGFADVGGYGKVNFFYIFDLGKAFDYFPFLSFTKEIYIKLFDRFYIWPVFQLAIYLGFLGLCLGFYWLMMQFYKMLDDHYELRNARIKLYEKITGKKSKAKLFYGDEGEDNVRD